MSDSQGPAMDDPTPPRPAVRWLLWMSVAAGLFAYRSLLTPSDSSAALSDQVEDWLFMPSDTEPLVILLLAAWLLYRRKDRWRQLPAGASSWGTLIALFAPGALLVAWAALTAATNLLPISLGFMVLGTAAVLRGGAGVRLVALPAAFLVFAVPLPGPLVNAVVYQFQIWTADWAGWLLYLMGSSAFVSGDLILKPGETFSIIEGCSGMRSVETLTMLAVLLTDLFHRRGLHAVLLVVMAPGVAFLMNGLRVLTLIFNPHSEIVAIHNLQGVAILLGGLLLLSFIDAGLSRLLRPMRPSAPAPDSGGTALQMGSAVRAQWLGAAAWGMCAILSVSIPQWPEPAPAPAGLRARFGAAIGEWIPSAIELDRTFLGTVWFRESIQRRFQSHEESVDLFLAVGDRRQRGLSLLSPKTAIPESGLRVLKQGEAVLEPGDQMAEWRLMRSDVRRVLVYHWYIPGASLAQESVQAAFGLQASPFRMAGEVAVVRLSTDVEGVGERGMLEASERLARFYREIQPVLEQLKRSLVRNQFS